jgi:protein-S-isoprenylcysteine O-methyltransferase Ste14
LLKIAAYLAYLAAWFVVAAAAFFGQWLRLRKFTAASETTIATPVVIGSLLQVLAAFLITRSLPTGPLHPQPLELIGALVLAPLGAALFTWSLRSVPKDADTSTLVTAGAYAWLRHPIYLAFLAMLLATGFLISSGMKLILPVVLYLAGSELRIASEESDLAQKFPEDYAQYCSRTRWRYLPGLR